MNKLFCQTEIEAKFFIPLRHLSTYLNFRRLPLQIISQAYIPKALIPRLLEDLDKPFAKAVAAHSDYCSRVRLRRITFVNGKAGSFTRFYLQLKSPKRRAVKRTEVSIEIPRQLFQRLSPYASGGRIDKARYIDRGYILDAKGKRHGAEAHIDIILAAGREVTKRSVPSRRLPHGLVSSARYAFVEIEFPKVSLLSRLKKERHHSFAYLRHAINLVHEHPHIKETITTRFIARSGLENKKVANTLRKLMKRCA